MEFKPGSKCFAKVKGYSPWPARIDVLPFDVRIPRGKYPIFFYGTHEVSFVTAKDIYDFDKFRSIFGMYKEKNTKFNDGIDEINDNPTIYQLGFDDRAVEFLGQFYKFDSRKINDETYRKLVRVVRLDEKYKQSATASDRKRPRNLNDSPDDKEPVLKVLRKEDTETNITPLREDLTLKSRQEHSKDDFIDKKCEIFNEELENNDSTDVSDKTEKEIVLNSFKSPTEATDPDRPTRASAMKFKQNFKSYVQNLSVNQKCPDKKPESPVKIRKDYFSSKYKKPERKNSLSEDNIHPKTEKLSTPIQNLTIDHNKTPSGLANYTSSVYSKDEKNLRIVSKLSIIDKEIKRSLIVGQENHEKCRKLMGNLLDLNNLSLILICRVPEIIVTIRKCRRYKKDDMIKSSASQIFQHFCQIYEDADLEEKIEAGAELLKRDSSDCKSAQTLFNELFVIEKPNQFSKHKLTSLTLSSPSSAHSIPSSADNTPSLNTDTFNDVSELGLTLDPDVININDLIESGMLVLIESYSFEESVNSCKRKPSNVTKEKRLINDDMELYKQLGV